MVVFLKGTKNYYGSINDWVITHMSLPVILCKNIYRNTRTNTRSARSTPSGGPQNFLHPKVSLALGRGPLLAFLFLRTLGRSPLPAPRPPGPTPHRRNPMLPRHTPAQRGGGASTIAGRRGPRRKARRPRRLGLRGGCRGWLRRARRRPIRGRLALGRGVSGQPRVVSVWCRAVLGRGGWGAGRGPQPSARRNKNARRGLGPGRGIPSSCADLLKGSNVRCVCWHVFLYILT